MSVDQVLHVLNSWGFVFVSDSVQVTLEECEAKLGEISEGVFFEDITEYTYTLKIAHRKTNAVLSSMVIACYLEDLHLVSVSGLKERITKDMLLQHQDQSYLYTLKQVDTSWDEILLLSNDLFKYATLFNPGLHMDTRMLILQRLVKDGLIANDKELKSLKDAFGVYYEDLDGVVLSRSQQNSDSKAFILERVGVDQSRVCLNPNNPLYSRGDLVRELTK